MDNTNNIFSENITTSSTIGFLLDIENDDIHTIKSYIPLYMCNIEMGSKIWDKNQKLDYSCIKNLPNNENVKIKNRNFIYLSPLQNIGSETPLPNIGEHISIKFIDEDINKGRYYSIVSDNSYKNDYQRWFVESTTSFEDIKESKSFSKRWNSTKNISSSTILSENLNSNSIKYKIDEELPTANNYTKGTIRSTYDLILDSKNDISGFRVLDQNNEIITSITTKQENKEILLKNKDLSEIKILGKDINISNDNGNINISNNISSIELNENIITIQNDKIKIIISDDIYVEKDNNRSRLQY